MNGRIWTIGFVAAWLFACGGANNKTDTAATAVGPTGTIEDGETMIEKGDFAGAASLFEEIAEQSPTNPKAFYYLGLARKNLGDLNAAIKSYEKAVSLDPKLMDAHINLGLALLDKGDLRRAESELRIYLDASPDAADAHFNYGLVQEAMGDIEKAKTHYEKAAALDPEDPSPLFGLGDVARKSGKRESALEFYEKARTLDPEMAGPAFAKGETLLEMKKTKKACETFQGLLSMQHPDLLTVVEAGKRIADADKACAAALYRGAVEKDDTLAAAHFYLANALARDKAFAEAATHFERFLVLAPNDPAAPEAKKRLDACKAQTK